MSGEAISKLIPLTFLLVLGIIEALGGLYFEDKRTKNDFSIEIILIVTYCSEKQKVIEKV